MEIYKGIPVSPGVVIGRVFVLDQVRQRVPRRVVASDQVGAETARFDAALRESTDELEQMRVQVESELGSEAAKIFAFHQGMLRDPSLTSPIRARIEREHVKAEYAVAEEFRALADRFARMGDSSFATKVDDIWDLERRVLRRLVGEHRSRLPGLTHPVVVVAHELTPSEAAGFRAGKVVGFATETGGRTSHTGIVAHAMGIPAVAGVARLADHAADGDEIIVDGDRGVVVLHPDVERVASYKRYIERMRLFGLSLEELRDAPSVTRDGVKVSLQANIEFPHEAKLSVENGGEGVGLYRTEFLWMTSDHDPTEEEQFEQYSEAVRALDGKTLTIRTFDLGADKAYGPRSEGAPESNPFLGLRSIRYCLQNLPMFKRQLRAILRASAVGPVRVMFPLVTSTTELRHAKMVLRDAMEDLAEEGVPFDRDIPVGMMVEAPSAALMAATFAREVSFFSIGTNDLVQYVLAVDRTNEQVANLYTAAHPAVLIMLKEVVRAARRQGVDVSVCGEMAGEPEYVMLLIGIGLRSLSVSPAAIPRVKRIVRSVEIDQCERLARRVGSFDSERQVLAYLRDQVRTIIPEAFDGRAVEEP